jgi:hypothetical protein
MLAVAELISSEAGPAAGTESEKKGKLFLSSNIKSCTAVHTPTHTCLGLSKSIKWCGRRNVQHRHSCVCVQRHSNLQMSLQTTSSFCSREIIAFFVLLLLLSAEILVVQRCSLKNKYRDVLTNQLGSHFDCAVVLRHNRFCTTSSTSLNGSNGAGGE